MADSASLSLDDYIKIQKKSGKMAFGRGRRGRGGPTRGGRANANNAGFSGGANVSGSYGKRGGRNAFRRRRGQASNNGPRGRGGQGYRAGSITQQYARAGPSQVRANQGRFRGGSLQNMRQGFQGRTGFGNRQARRKRTGGNAGFGNARYFNNSISNNTVGGAGSGRGKRNQNRAFNLRQKKALLSNSVVVQKSLIANRNTKRAVLKLAKKRVQRAKLLVSKKKATTSLGNAKKLKMIPTTGRVALGRNGFVTVGNSNAKRMERAMVQMKIARAQHTRNQQNSPQRVVSIPSTSPASGNRSRPRVVRPRRGGGRPQPNPSTSNSRNWSTPGPIVRTMTNEFVDEMTSSELDPEIQRKIAFIQSRSRGERSPVMPDFKAPVTTSRMKLSDRFRLIRDQ